VVGWIAKRTSKGYRIRRLNSGKSEIGLLLRIDQPLTIGFVIADNFNTRWIISY